MLSLSRHCPASASQEQGQPFDKLRANVIRLCRENAIPVFERNFSLTDVYGADEAFTTGTFAGLVPVRTIDGRFISEGRAPMVERLQGLYRALVEADVAAAARP